MHKTRRSGTVQSADEDNTTNGICIVNWFRKRRHLMSRCHLPTAQVRLPKLLQCTHMFIQEILTWVTSAVKRKVIIQKRLCQKGQNQLHWPKYRKCLMNQLLVQIHPVSVILSCTASFHSFLRFFDDIFT